MKWVAWAFNQGARFADELNEQEFNELSEKRTLLLQYVEAQETYRAVLDNHSELEIALLSIAQEAIHLGHISHSRAMYQRLLLDRRYANLLSICRMYLNYAAALACTLGSEERFRTATNSAYDSSLGYRVMEALRNYVQHRGFPLSAISHNFRAKEGSGEGPIEVCVIPGLALERLKSDANFKQAVFSEIEALGDKADLRIWGREYVDGITRCHLVLLSDIEPKVDDAISAQKLACTRFSGRGAQPGTIVRYEQRDDDNKVIKQMALSTEFTEHIQLLRLENRCRDSNAKKYVTNATNF